jgi:HK97 family phage major capsid protein
MMTEKTAAELAAEVKSDFTTKLDAVKAIAEKAAADAATPRGMTPEEKQKADEALTALNEAQARLTEVEQKLAREPGDGSKEEKTIGEKFIESDSFKSLANSPGQRGKAQMEVKATITLATANSAGSAGATVANTRLPGILPLAQRRLTVRDLLLPGTMNGNTLEYVRETGFTNSAAPVAEGAAKPASDLKFDLVSTTAKVIAHYMKASRQILDDSAQLSSIINQRLLYGLKLVEEAQLLNGAGTGQNLNGLVTQSTAYSAPITLSSPTSVDMIRLMALQASLTEFPASGIVMHPSDWAWIELLKDTTGQYLIGQPQGSLRPTLWGLPVVATQAMTIDKVLVGAFGNAQVFDRWQARVEVATENEDDFIKNLVTILCEERLALAVYRPESFIYGDFGRV